MPINLLAQLGDAPNLCDESEEADVRKQFLDRYVSPDVNFVFDSEAALNKYEAGDLYIGSHRCKQMGEGADLVISDMVYVELWAIRDPETHKNGDDWLTWILIDYSPTDVPSKEHIGYCPWCGAHLCDQIRNEPK